MIVVETNIIAYLFLTSGRSQLSEAALYKDPVWVAPLLWRSEMRNVLALYLRKGLLSLEDAQAMIKAASDLMHGGEYEVASDHVLALVKNSACSVYDCELVALARDLKVPLVTADRQILKDFPETALALEAYLAAE